MSLDVSDRKGRGPTSSGPNPSAFHKLIVADLLLCTRTLYVSTPNQKDMPVRAYGAYQQRGMSLFGSPGHLSSLLL